MQQRDHMASRKVIFIPTNKIEEVETDLLSVSGSFALDGIYTDKGIFLDVSERANNYALFEDVLTKYATVEKHAKKDKKVKDLIKDKKAKKEKKPKKLKDGK